MEWLENITSTTMVLVPTRGLQHSLAKGYAEQQIAKGHSAWQTPQILVWEDYIEQLWRANKQNLDKAYIRLDNAQAYLVWQQIITAAKKDDAELLLLNEQQTASVVQRSWKLAHKWQVDIQAMQQRDDLDSIAFAKWCQAYHRKLDERYWIDSSQVESLLINMTASLNGLCDEIVFAYFDLVSSNQKEHIRVCQDRGIKVTEYSMTDAQTQKIEPLQISYKRYQQEDQEWRTIFQHARQLMEENSDTRIGIVIPSLSEQRARVEQVVRSVFYPNLSPLQCQQQDLVYRFSLGQPLNKIAYVHSMLVALELLKNTFSYQSLHSLLISEWWPFRHQLKHADDLIRLDRAIKNSRGAWLSWQDVLTICQTELPDAQHIQRYIEKLIEFKGTIFDHETTLEKETFSGQTSSVDQAPKKFNVHTARHWQIVFSQWLTLLEWPENDLDSWHYQAHESWLETLETFVGHDLVQGKTGLSRALHALTSLCKDKVYMRQAKDEPILISGVLEGIGQDVDYLFVTGMHEAYPPPMRQDPFIANAALEEQGYPFANKRMEFTYENNKLASLMAGGKQIEMSYAAQQIDGEYSVTALLRDQEFISVGFGGAIESDAKQAEIQLEEYTDTIGLECLQSSSIKGGSKVFENQSQCPFKAYVEHRLLRQNEEEPEFGLDARDAGTVVHELLDNIWNELQSFSSLNRLGEEDLKALIGRHVDAYIEQPNSRFQFDRQRLLKLEKPRLKQLLLEWFVLEQEQRSLPYTVIGREKAINSEFGGIPIRLVIDRVDQTDSGDCLIIDYKTGQAEISAWNGERLKSPQMPLYALALDRHSDYNIKGIAFGKLKTDDCELIGVTELEGVGEGFKACLNSRDKKTWSEQLQEWSDNLNNLAAEFLDGQAIVDPSKAKPCQFCDLHSLCRINQLQSQSGQATDDLVNLEGNQP